MKRIIVTFAICLFLQLSLSSSATLAQKHTTDTNFDSTTRIYSAFFPIPMGQETARSSRLLDKQIHVHSYVSAEYQSKELGHYIKYSVSVEPLEKYTPYKDIVEDKVNELIYFYESQYDFNVSNVSDINQFQRWGKDLTIEFHDTPIPEAERPESYTPWVLRRQIFHKSKHIFTLEALGSQAYLNAPTTEKFFKEFIVHLVQ